jgi:dipeptidyl aminopeptidase/acylaminoacyl peptidase
MKVERIEFQSAGCRCSGMCFIPHNWCRPLKLPTVVLVPGGHGFATDAKDSDCGFGLMELAKAFCSEGFVACGYDGRGQGQSEGKRTGHNLAIEDLEVVLKSIREKCDAVDPGRIGLFGQSLGGMASVIVAGLDESIRSVVLWGTLPRYSILKTETGKRAEEVLIGLYNNYKEAGGDSPYVDFVSGFQMYDPIEHIGQLRIPILLAGGSDDHRFFRTSEQDELFEAAKSSSQVFCLKVKGEPHRTRHWSPPFPVLAKMLSAWFCETI